MASSSPASQQAEQAALVVLLQRELAQLSLSTSNTYLEPATALVQEYAAASAATAADWYEELRDKAGGRIRFTVPVADPPTEAQVRGSLSWATAPLRGSEPDRALARSQVEGAAQRLVVNTGRETIARAVTADQYARAWARVPTGAKTCYFCALMCSRGAIYATRETAGADANKGFAGEGQFKFHDLCDCEIIPVFRGQKYEPSERIQSWDALYRKVTGSVDGAEKLRAFRRAYEAV